MTPFRPNETDNILTALLKDMSFDVEVYVLLKFKTHIHFFIESVLLREKGDRYINERIKGFTPIQCQCYSLVDDKVNHTVQYLFISDYILDKLEDIKRKDIQLVTNTEYNVITVIVKDAGVACLETL